MTEIRFPFCLLFSKLGTTPVPLAAPFKYSGIAPKAGVMQWMDRGTDSLRQAEAVRRNCYPSSERELAPMLLCKEQARTQSSLAGRSV